MLRWECMRDCAAGTDSEAARDYTQLSELSAQYNIDLDIDVTSPSQFSQFTYVSYLTRSKYIYTFHWHC